MKKKVYFLLCIHCFCQLYFSSLNAQVNAQKRFSFPDSIYSGLQGQLHVQGIAIDEVNKFVYWSFTDRLIKTDFSGRLIGSINGFIGHLGDLDFNKENGEIFASLEYKNDAIGKGIQSSLGIHSLERDGFYIAIFDGAKINRPNMNAEDKDLLYTVYLKEPVIDYEDSVWSDGNKLPHRFACSGIDGLTFGPAFGAPRNSKKYLYVAYGIYGDSNRIDNDNQIILKYDVKDWFKYKRKVSQKNLVQLGPLKPIDKYFLHTGATNYGIQNLAYDAYSGDFYAAVYKGTKSTFPNYDLFVIDGKKEAHSKSLFLYNHNNNVKFLAIKPFNSKGTDYWGRHLKWGSTGICPIGNGAFYLSHNGKDKEGNQYSILYKYKWDDHSDQGFIPALK